MRSLKRSALHSTLVATLITLAMAALALGARPAEAAPFVYVSNEGSQSISVIDRAVDRVVATIPVGDVPGALAITPDGRFVYVATGYHTVSVIATASNTVVRTIAVTGTLPQGVAITPDGKFVYVTNFYGAPAAPAPLGSITVIATASNTVVATITAGENLQGVAVTPNGRFVYVTNWPNNTVLVISTASNTVVNAVTVGGYPEAVAITPNGKFAYVTNSGDNTVSVISTDTVTVVGTPIPVGESPHDVAITPDGKTAFVTNSGDGTVSFIDTASNTSSSPDADIDVGSFPNGLATSPSQGKYIYIANRDSNTVSEISLPSFAVLHTINIPIGLGGESPHPFDVVIQRQANNGLSSHPRGQSKVMPANSRNRP